MSEALEALALLNAEAETVVIEAADGSPAEDLAGAVYERVLEAHAYADGQDWAVVADRAVGRLDNGLAALVVPACRVMLAPTVEQVAGHLEAVWTLEPVNADAPVERFLIGDNIMDNGPTYYGCYRNQAVITRTQPLDIQFASMLPQTRYLMLTDLGGPIEFVKAEAHERDIPLRQISTSTI